MKSSLLIVVSFLLLFYGTLQITWGGAQNDDKNIDKFNFVAAGDFGCGDEPNKTIQAMTKKDPELVIALVIFRIINLLHVGLIV